MPVLNRTKVGFTLIELVIGIAVFSVVMTIIIGLIAPQAARSVDPIMQVKATELAQSVLNEISSKLFDHNSDRAGGRVRCNESLNGDADTNDVGESACTAIVALGADGETRDKFDDVDDYIALVYDPTDGLNTNDVLTNSIGENISALYPGFKLSVNVFYDADFNGVADNVVGNVKYVKVSVTTPAPESFTINFATYKSNF